VKRDSEDVRVIHPFAIDIEALGLSKGERTPAAVKTRPRLPTIKILQSKISNGREGHATVRSASKGSEQEK
jgi:hypothetical protein